MVTSAPTPAHFQPIDGGTTEMYRRICGVVRSWVAGGTAAMVRLHDNASEATSTAAPVTRPAFHSRRHHDVPLYFRARGC